MSFLASRLQTPNATSQIASTTFIFFFVLLYKRQQFRHGFQDETRVKGEVDGHVSACKLHSALKCIIKELVCEVHVDSSVYCSRPSYVVSFWSYYQKPKQN